MDAKTFHQICLSIVQLYRSLKSAKGLYMTDSVWHTASTPLCSLLQSFFFHLVISIFNQRTDQSSGSEVNLNVSYFKKLKPLEIGNFNSQVFFLILL